MTGCPPAALAALRAALVDTARAGRTTPEDTAQQLVDQLAADGWTLTPTPGQITES